MAKKYPHYIQSFRQLGYKFRMNEMDDSIEVNGERLNGGLSAKIESEMKDLGFPSAYWIRKNWERFGYENRYHPVHEYLNSLQWVGDPMIDYVISKLEFSNGTEAMARQFLFRFLLGVVGKVLEQDQNFMLVFDGPQGIGKSHFSRWLCPPKLSRYFVEGSLNPDSNDTKLRVISNMIWEVGELQYTTRKADVEALKNVISQKYMTVRRPYGREDIEKPITTSFIGTINETGAGFLNDRTGSRRFVVIKLTGIDWTYTDLDVDQLWAQVMTCYRSGERGFLTPEEQEEQQKINGSYDITSPVLELFLKHYDVDPAQFNEWIPIADIITHLEGADIGLKGNQRGNQMELAGILNEMGLEKSRSAPVTGFGRQTCYYGIRQKITSTSSVWGTTK
jgi:predicted P-loop ATPase